MLESHEGETPDTMVVRTSHLSDAIIAKSPT